ncbi:hypothetical protein QA597_10440 [Marinilabiliaceae bacterium ANBcel2]|nr:hypothetical protein [Marinilabiliaceae bacterium ANBcel2]
MVNKHKFEIDFKKVSQLFPKLRYTEKKSGWSIYGDMDICDIQGHYWETFDIEIFISNAYPYCTPVVWEKSFVIKRHPDFHIDVNGCCCIDIEHKLLMYQTRGMDLFGFIKDKVYPFFVNQVYRKYDGNYASGEYAHRFDGIIQFYKEELEIHSPELAIEILQKILDNNLPQRYDSCICGKKKYKICHYASVEYLKLVPKTRLVKDILVFESNWIKNK